MNRANRRQQLLIGSIILLVSFSILASIKIFHLSDVRRNSIIAVRSSSILRMIKPDAIVVGSGLAGLVTTLKILDRGGKVALIEKEHRLGGNSIKASSGINACRINSGGDDADNKNDSTTDVTDAAYCSDLESFKEDTIRSAGDTAQIPLIETLVANSARAVDWLKERLCIDLSLRSQLGGHSRKRTYRPSKGPVGFEIISAIQNAVRAYEKTGMVEILVDTQVTKLLQDDTEQQQGRRVTGVEVSRHSSSSSNTEHDKSTTNDTSVILAPNVILATGGYAADRSAESYLAKYRPELLQMPATFGSFSTGDGIRIATALGAGVTNLDKIQIHPTGFVDPTDPTNPTKFLAAELLRGVGGILMNNAGRRFCNEVGTRAYVTDAMLGHDRHYAATKKWQEGTELPKFFLVLSSAAAADGGKHVEFYTFKGLLKKMEGVTALADWMGVDASVLTATLKQYQHDAEKGIDEWGKSTFHGVPGEDLDKEVFFAGIVTPVLHYCMGGITIDTQGNVLDENGAIIQGLHAAGEVTGGVHGNNRLGGNSLLECTVYGTIIGEKIPLSGDGSSSVELTCKNP